MSPFFPIIILSISFIFITYKLFSKHNSKLPPGPFPWPVIGNIFIIKFPIFRCFSDWSRIYGPIISVWIGSSLDIVVTTSEFAEQVLKDNDHLLANRHRTATREKYTEDGLGITWADYGPFYVKLRKICNIELFSQKRLEDLRPTREDEVMAVIESIYKDCVSANNVENGLLLRTYLREVTCNCITRMVLGKRFASKLDKNVDEQALEFRELVDDVVRSSISLGLVEYFPWLKLFFQAKEKEIDKHKARRDQLTRIIMKEHGLISTTSKQCFLNALLTHQESYNLSEDTIIGLIWDMINAGMDTSAILVEWAMAEVIKNSNIQLKAHQELSDVIGSKRALTEPDLLNLPYLKNIVKETLRLHPPTPLMLPHKAKSDIRLGGYDIPVGANVHVNVWAIGRDPAHWASPLEFRPERFDKEDVDMKGHDFRLLPFGAGRRMCPGAHFGINIVSLILGNLLLHFNWNLPKGVKVEDIDMMENPGLVAYMRTPLQAVANPRLPRGMYKCVANA